MTPAQAATDSQHAFQVLMAQFAEMFRRHYDASDGIDLVVAGDLAVLAARVVRDEGWRPVWGQAVPADPTVPLGQRLRADYYRHNAEIFDPIRRMGGAR